MVWGTVFLSTYMVTSALASSVYADHEKLMVINCEVWKLWFYLRSQIHIQSLSTKICRVLFKVVMILTFQMMFFIHHLCYITNCPYLPRLMSGTLFTKNGGKPMSTHWKRGSLKQVVETFWSLQVWQFFLMDIRNFLKRFVLILSNYRVCSFLCFYRFWN